MKKIVSFILTLAMLLSSSAYLLTAGGVWLADINGSKSVGKQYGYPRYYIYHCRGDHWSSENVRLTPYATAITLRTNLW